MYVDISIFTEKNTFKYQLSFKYPFLFNCATKWRVSFGCRSSYPAGVLHFRLDVYNRPTNRVFYYRVRTTAYHPQANGLVERFHRQLKVALTAPADRIKWNDSKSESILTSVKVYLHCSTTELDFNAPFRVQSQFSNSPLFWGM